MQPANFISLALLGALLLFGGASRADESAASSMGGWNPPPDVLDAARALGQGDETSRHAALERVEALPAARRVEILRAGLRLPDGPAAMACAARLRWTEVDDAESARIVSLGLLDALQPDSAFDFDEVRSLLGSTEIQPLLDRLAVEPRISGAAQILSDVHRQVRAVHVPALCRLALIDDEDVAKSALENLRIAVGFTDRHREEVARTILALGPWPTKDVRQPEPGAPRVRSVELLAKRAGWPPALVAVVQTLWLEGARAPDWIWEFDRWALRWIHEAAPAAEDLGTLASLVKFGLAEESDRLLCACATALARLQDSRADRLLEQIAAREDIEGFLFAVAPLAARGAVAHRDRMLADAHGEDASLALALHAAADPVQGGRLLRERLLSGQPADALAALHAVNASRFSQDMLCDGPLIPALAYTGLEDAAVASELPGLDLARLGARVPACRTARIAAAALGRLAIAPSNEQIEVHGGTDRLLARDMAFLEVADGDELRRVLRRWAANESPSTVQARDLALQALLLLGDPESGGRLAAWVESGAADATSDSEVPAIVLLARSVSPAVTAYIDEKVASDSPPLALAAKAVLGGLPECVALALADAFDPEADDAEVRDARARLVRDGKAVEVVLEWCFREEEMGMADVGLVRDERVVAALRRVRDARERGLYLWATCQLMLAGDDEATAELDRALRTGRYRWIDNREPLHLTLGGRLDRLPMWIDELESNCCRAVPIFEMLTARRPGSALLDIPHPQAGSARWTPAAIVRRAWAEDGGEAQPYSRLAGLHVPVVR